RASGAELTAGNSRNNERCFDKQTARRLISNRQGAVGITERPKSGAEYRDATAQSATELEFRIARRDRERLEVDNCPSRRRSANCAECRNCGNGKSVQNHWNPSLSYSTGRRRRWHTLPPACAN